MASATKPQTTSKIRGRVSSTEKPVSKIRGRVSSTEKPVSKMEQLLADIDFAPKSYSKGEKVDGKIVSTIADSLLVDIGAKAEAILPKKELEQDMKDLKEGDKVSAFVAQPENDSGVIILTAKKDQKDQAWEVLQKLSEKGEVVSVKSIETNRGGLIVEYNGTRGFVPSSHLVTNAKDSLGKKLQVKPLEVNKSLNKLVFSEREVVGDSLPKIELPFKVGDSLDVGITKILPFGLLVSLKGGSEGLVHISEISWTRVENLPQIFKIDQKIKVKVISIDAGSGRVNLSIKQLEKDPWEAAAKKYKVGTVVERKVSRAASYGVFVGLEEGIEGLLHSSKIPYGVDLKPGENVKISIDLFNSEQKRVALRLAPKEDSSDNKEEKTPKKPKEIKTKVKTKKETKIIAKKESKKEVKNKKLKGK